MGGNIFSSLFDRLIKLTKCPDMRILMLGLDSAGKTTILYRLKLGNIVATTPTIGLNVETLDYKNFHLVVWDIGGQSKIRPLWRHYYQDAQAVIFVVDSSDRERIGVAREEVQRIIDEDMLSDAAMLVFANKQDLPNAMCAAEVTQGLGLYTTRTRDWFIQSTCATSGEGIHDGLDWLVSVLAARG